MFFVMEEPRSFINNSKAHQGLMIKLSSEALQQSTIYTIHQQLLQQSSNTAQVPIYIILVTRVSRDHLHSVTELALDRTEVCKAFEDHFYNSNACQDHRISFYTCIVYMATPHNLTSTLLSYGRHLCYCCCCCSVSGYSANGCSASGYQQCQWQQNQGIF